MNTLWLTCGVLKREVSELLSRGAITGTLFSLDSMLHMDPPALEKILSFELTRLGSSPKKIVIVYGDCCPRMLDLVKQYKVGRVNAINCAQMLLGKEKYREMMRRNSFMLLPEWAPRWKEVFRKELGLSHEVAFDLMTENRGDLVYLDTGLVPVPKVILLECSQYTGLALSIETLTLEPLLRFLTEAQDLPNE